MEKKEKIGLWVDIMENKSVKKRKKISKLAVYNNKFNEAFDTVIKQNGARWIISTTLAIPVTLITTKLSRYIGSLNFKKEDMILFMSLVMIMLFVPFVLTYFYLGVFFNKKDSINKKRKRRISKLLFIFFICIFTFHIFKQIITYPDKDSNKRLFLVLFFTDIYFLTSEFTKIIYLVYEKISQKIHSLSTWIFKREDNGDDEIIRAKLSLISKIITGGLAIIGSILATLLTIKQLIG